MNYDVINRDTSSSGLLVIAPPLADAALDDLLAGVQGQVVLVEPDPDRARWLRTLEGVRVIDAAIGQKIEQKPLVRFNFPGLRSLFAATPALKEALPGLREVGRMTVSVITPAELAQQLEDLPEPLALHVDFPGAEMTILEGLAAHGLLARAVRLHLRCGTEPMVEGAVSRAALQDWVLKQGFTLYADTSDDPDWAELDFRVDLVARALDETRSELATSKDTVHKQQVQITAFEQELADSRAALKAREADLAKVRDERDNARGQAEQRNKRIAELEKTVNETRRTLARTEKTLSGTETALQDASKSLEENADALTARDQQVASLEQELADSRAALKAREADLAKVSDERDNARGQAEQRNKRIAELEKTVNKAQENAQQAKSDLGVALRMQMLAQSDLQDLQVRFREVEQARAAQQALLEKLTPRLQQAAHQLQRLHLAENTLAVLDPTDIDDQRPAGGSGGPQKAKTTPKAPKKARTKTPRKSSKKTETR